MNSSKDDFKELVKFLAVYQSRKTRTVGLYIEHAKNISVDGLMHRRGRFQKHVWHTSMVGLSAFGVLTSGVLGGNSIVASSFPGMGAQDPRYIETFDPFASGISLQNFINLKTSVSDKPRSETIDYEVKGGDTLSGIADKFGVSVNTIKWANSMTSDSVKPGDTLKILPVSGVSHTVKSGDTLESVAKKYTAEQQAILDYPFNDIGDDFKLRIGQVLIIPEGTPPEVAAPPKPRIVAPPANQQPGSSGPAFSAPAGGNFVWPTTYVYISQYFAWYHPGVDLPNPSSPPVVAADGGVVTVAGWPDNYGYGNRVMIDHGNGYVTLYAHLSNIYVSAGQHVSRGQSVGRMGNTGRSTGTHLHFEIRFKGIAINPLAILR